MSKTAYDIWKKDVEAIKSINKIRAAMESEFMRPLERAVLEIMRTHYARISETLPQQDDTGGANATEETTK